MNNEDFKVTDLASDLGYSQRYLSRVLKQFTGMSPVKFILEIYTNPQEFKDFLFSQNLENTALLLMSSGNYGGLDFNEVKDLVV